MFIHSFIYMYSFIKTLNHSWQTATEYTWYGIVIIVKQSNVNLEAVWLESFSHLL